MAESIQNPEDRLDPCVSVSFLPEEEEYIGKVMLLKRYCDNPTAGILLRLVGFVLFLAGLGLLLFTERTTSGIVLFNLMMIVGIVCLVWMDMVRPMARRSRAKSVFEKSPIQKNSVQIAVYSNRVTVQSDGLDAAFPLEVLPYVLEDGKLFLVAAGDQYQWMVPKRVLDEKQIQWLRETFAMQCGQRFVRFVKG